MSEKREVTRAELKKMIPLISGRRPAMISAWKRKFTVRLLSMGEVNIYALRDKDRQRTELAVRGRFMDLPDLFDKFDKMVRLFMKGHEALVLRMPIDVCWMDLENTAIYMICWHHTKAEAMDLGHPYEGG